MRSNFSLNLGLRTNTTARTPRPTTASQILDVSPQFTSARQCCQDKPGRCVCTFPASLVQPDRNNFAPRLGLAWHPMKQTAAAGLTELITISRNTQRYSEFLHFSRRSRQPNHFGQDPATSDLTLVNGFPGTAQWRGDE